MTDAGQCHATPPTQLLDAAIHIACRLDETALWDRGECTWIVSTPDRAHIAERLHVEAPAGPYLYNGTAGIGCFLGQLYSLTGDRRIRQLATGALKHAIRLGNQEPNTAFGFHCGRTGIAYAAWQLAARHGDVEWLDAARGVLKPLFGNEQADLGLDVIAGAAGAIPIFLQLAQDLEFPEARDSALALGEHLLVTARRGPYGWSWRSQGVSQVRDLAGLAHGAAGFGHALLELYAATGNIAFRYGATQAYAYETHVFDEQMRNWPDFRHYGIGKLLYEQGGISALADLIRSGEAAPPWVNTSMAAWCHGAPGIGLTRLRAFELLRAREYAEQARIAVETTASRIDTSRQGYSLCHGILGNCETLFVGSRILEEPLWLSRVTSIALEGIERFENRGVPWLSGAFNSVPDPSLMLGDAGVGHVFLRLADPTIRSVLLPTAPVSVLQSELLRKTTLAPAILTNPSFQPSAFSTADVHGWFSRTTRSFERLQPRIQDLCKEALSADSDCITAVVPRVYEAALRRIECATDASLKALLTDAFRPERVRFETASAITDHTTELVEELLRQPSDDINWDRAVFRLSQGAALVECRWNWDEWLVKPTSTMLREGPITFVVFRHSNAAWLKSLNSFTASVLAAAKKGGSIDDIFDQVVSDHELSDRIASRPKRLLLRTKVQMQLWRAYVGRIVMLVDTATAAEQKFASYRAAEG